MKDDSKIFCVCGTRLWIVPLDGEGITVRPCSRCVMHACQIGREAKGKALSAANTEGPKTH